jgi:hypothetical protein
LVVKGFPSIYESLNSYTSDEILDGNNKYKAGEHGYQKAVKVSVYIFLEFFFF